MYPALELRNNLRTAFVVNFRLLVWVCYEAMDFAHRIFITDSLAKEITPLLVYGNNLWIPTAYIILISFNWNTFGTFRMKSSIDVSNCTLIVLKHVKFCLLCCRRKRFQSKKLVTFSDTTRHHIPQGSTLQKMFSTYISRHVKDIGVFVQVM